MKFFVPTMTDEEATLFLREKLGEHSDCERAIYSYEYRRDTPPAGPSVVKVQVGELDPSSPELGKVILILEFKNQVIQYFAEKLPGGPRLPSMLDGFQEVVSITPFDTCPICLAMPGAVVRAKDFGRRFEVECCSCGNFGITNTACQKIGELAPQHRRRLSEAIRKRSAPESEPMVVHEPPSDGSITPNVVTIDQLLRT